MTRRTQIKNDPDAVLSRIQDRGAGGEGRRSGGIRYLGMGGLVQPSPTAETDWKHATCDVRAGYYDQREESARVA